MNEFLTLAEIDKIANHILRSFTEQRNTQFTSRVGLILGSGLGKLADVVQEAVYLPYVSIPGWPVSTVQGHAGQLVSGLLENQPVLVMQGRSHYYEGYSIAKVCLPVRVMQRLGIEILIVTNAAGGVNPAFTPGDLMLILDHINLIGMAGLSPLRGENLDTFGPRFPDMSQAYDRQLNEFARQAAVEAGIILQEGIYTSLAGPSFETPAELRFLRVIGTDAVGMSTVPEVIIARHGSTRVLGISGISNKANLDGSTITSHVEVLEAGKQIVPKLVAVIKGVLRRL